MYNTLCSEEIRAISSAGQSYRLITGRSKVRILDGPPLKYNPNHFIVGVFFGQTTKHRQGWTPCRCFVLFEEDYILYRFFRFGNRRSGCKDLVKLSDRCFNQHLQFDFGDFNALFGKHFWHRLYNLVIFFFAVEVFVELFDRIFWYEFGMNFKRFPKFLALFPLLLDKGGNTNIIRQLSP